MDPFLSVTQNCLLVQALQCKLLNKYTSARSQPTLIKLLARLVGQEMFSTTVYVSNTTAVTTGKESTSENV